MRETEDRITLRTAVKRGMFPDVMLVWDRGELGRALSNFCADEDFKTWDATFTSWADQGPGEKRKRIVEHVKLYPVGAITTFVALWKCGLVKPDTVARRKAREEPNVEPQDNLSVMRPLERGRKSR